MALCRDNPRVFKHLSWDEFAVHMRRLAVCKAYIVSTAAEATRITLDIRIFDSMTRMRPGLAGVLADYCLVDRGQNDKLLPCLVLIDGDNPHALDKAFGFYDCPVVLSYTSPADGHGYTVMPVHVGSRDQQKKEKQSRKCGKQ